MLRQNQDLIINRFPYRFILKNKTPCDIFDHLISHFRTTKGNIQTQEAFDMFSGRYFCIPYFKEDLVTYVKIVIFIITIVSITVPGELLERHLLILKQDINQSFDHLKRKYPFQCLRQLIEITLQLDFIFCPFYTPVFFHRFEPGFLI